MADFDALIIGAGPAGLSAALRLAGDGWRVLVLEKDKLPRAKVCGGYVSARGWEALTGLGLADRLHPEAGPLLTHASVTFPWGKEIVVPLSQKAAPRAAPREALHRLLLEAALEKGVSVQDRSFVQRVSRTRNGWEALGARAKFLIVAAGYGQRLEEAKNSSDRWIGLETTLERIWEDPSRLYLYAERQGYVGVVRQARSTHVAALIRPGPESLEWLKGFARNLGWGEPEWRGIGPLLLGSRGCLSPDGGLCVGDAAGCVDPWMGQGIALALESGLLAADTLRESRAQGWSLLRTQGIYRVRWWARFGRFFAAGALIRRTIFSKRQALNPAFFRPFLVERLAQAVQ